MSKGFQQQKAENNKKGKKTIKHSFLIYLNTTITQEVWWRIVRWEGTGCVDEVDCKNEYAIHSSLGEVWEVPIIDESGSHLKIMDQTGGILMAPEALLAQEVQEAAYPIPQVPLLRARPREVGLD